MEIKSTVMVPWIFTSSRIDKNTKYWRLSRIPWHGLVLYKMLNIGCGWSSCQRMSNDKEEANKQYGLLPPKIAESVNLSLGHGLCGSGGSIYNMETSQNTLSAWTQNDRSSNKPQVGLKTLKPQISQQHPSRICFITLCWYVTHDFNLLVFDNRNVREFKREFKPMCMQDNYGIKAKPTTSHN
jgi:hypothetical protein